MMNLNDQQRQELLTTGLKMLEAVKNDTVQSSDALPMVGTGVFTTPGVRPDMYSAVQRPTNDFLSALPMMRSEFEREAFAILTSVTASSGSNPSDVCGTPPVTGDLKEMKIVASFGDLFLGSEKVNVTRIGTLQDRAVMPRTIYNYATGNDPFTPEPLREAATIGGADLFRDERSHQYYKLGVGVRRAVASIDVDGDSSLSNTVTETGWIKEFDGLGQWVKAGYTDAKQGVAAPAADSAVVNFLNGNIANDTITLNGQTLNIVEVISALYYSRLQVARKANLGVQWALVMDERMFPELAYVYSATYSHQRYAGSTNTTETVNRDRAEIQRRFEDMLNNYYLPIYGQQVPVLFSSGRETSEGANGALNGDLYIVAMSADGNPLTYLEYMDLNNAYLEEWNAMHNVTGRLAVNNGLYLMATRSSGFCDEVILASRMRLIHRAPFLSARLNNVAYNQYTNYRDWQPGTTSFYGGGVTVSTPAWS